MLSVDQLEDKLIDLAFAEDIGDGDHTTLCCIPDDAMGKSHLLIKEDGVPSSLVMAMEVTSVALVNCFACSKAFCPVEPSRTSITSSAS